MSFKDIKEKLKEPNIFDRKKHIVLMYLFGPNDDAQDEVFVCARL